MLPLLHLVCNPVPPDFVRVLLVKWPLHADLWELNLYPVVFLTLMLISPELFVEVVVTIFCGCSAHSGRKVRDSRVHKHVNTAASRSRAIDHLQHCIRGFCEGMRLESFVAGLVFVADSKELPQAVLGNLCWVIAVQHIKVEVARD